MKRLFCKHSKDSIIIRNFTNNTKANKLLKHYMEVYDDYLKSNGHKEVVLLGRLLEIQYMLKADYKVSSDAIDFAEQIIEMKQKVGDYNV